MRYYSDYIKDLQSGVYNDRLKEIYLDNEMVPYNVARYEAAILKFTKLYGAKEIEIFSAPGRSEVSGNHTDHQLGHVLATSLNLDAIAIVAKADDMVIRLVSDDYPPFEIDLTELELKEVELGTTDALIRGVAAGLQVRGFTVGGFEAYVTSDVIIGAGLSSSAAFETLIGTIISGLYNDMQIPAIDVALVGEYAENVYFGKPSGLMDQVACSVGGLVYVDFKNEAEPYVKPVPSDFEENAYSLCIIDTQGSHENLTDEYAAIPEEMKRVAGYFGKEYLRDVAKDDFISNIAGVRENTGDRAVLRALHFFTEQERVTNAVEALECGDFQSFLKEIKASGDSSSKCLQNIYSTKDCHTQNVTLALSVSEYFLGENGVCRVHGGGFEGTVQAFVKNEAVAQYKESIEKIFGEDSCHVLKVRPNGGIKVM